MKAVTVRLLPIVLLLSFTSIAAAQSDGVRIAGRVIEQETETTVSFLIVHPNGYIENAQHLMVEGHFAWGRIAGLLPLDYEPREALHRKRNLPAPPRSLDVGM